MHPGYSLFELLTVMAIIVILLSIAYPNYQHHLLRIHRQEAQIQLMEIASALEDYHSLNNSYRGVNLKNLGITFSAYYDFELLDLSDDDYLIHASPQDKQRGDPCGILSLNQLGKKTAASRGCW